jgi:hypothetical protein
VHYPPVWTVPLVPRRVTALRWFGTVMALVIGVALGDADLERPERPLPGRRHELAKHGHTSVRVRIVGNVRWKPPVDDDRGVDLTPTSASTTGGAGTLVRPVPLADLELLTLRRPEGDPERTRFRRRDWVLVVNGPAGSASLGGDLRELALLAEVAGWPPPENLPATRREAWSRWR